MSSRIIRGDDRVQKMKITSPAEGGMAGANLLPKDHIMNVEKEAFEQGYREGERVGKQMGERMVEAVVKRYDRSIQEIAAAQRALLEAMEKQTVQLALEISKKVIQRELAMDADLVCALASVAIKRVHAHQAITLRVSGHDFERVRTCVASVNPAVSVKEDSALERGDFMLDTAQTHLDGRLSSQIETIGRALLHE
jgi:flagellar assembly protein FliH